MSLTLLPDHAAAAVAWERIDFGGTQSSPLGGADQRVNRLGGRWKMTVTLPAMDARTADEWGAALSEGLETGVSFRVPEPGWRAGSPGTVLVNGAGQAGSSLLVDGGTVGHVIRRGKWFSILTGGRRYLHKAAATVQLGAGGAATIQLTPKLRVIPADNSPVELAIPRIEGLLEKGPGWAVNLQRIAEGITFTIREQR